MCVCAYIYIYIYNHLIIELDVMENKYYYMVLISRKQLVSKQFNASLMLTTITMSLLYWKCLEVETS
jgi:hypothetical protein